MDHLAQAPRALGGTAHLRSNGEAAEAVHLGLGERDLVVDGDAGPGQSFRIDGRIFTRVDQSIAMAAIWTAHHLKVKAIAALTESGSTALWMSRLNCGVPVFALTNFGKHSFEEAVPMMDFLQDFDRLYVSGQMGVIKPDPRIYRMMIEALKVDPKNCVYLDDLGVNLKPAREMGMTTIKVVSAAQAIGELEALFPRIETTEEAK